MAKPKTYMLYGREHPAEIHPIFVELKAFREGWSIDSGGLGKAAHFKNVANTFWPWDEKTNTGFYWHPWADQGIQALCDYDYTGLAGGASCSKSELLSLWSLVNWMCLPRYTLVLITSTTVRDAKIRIWGSVQRYYNELPKGMFPGKLKDAPDPHLEVMYDGKKYFKAGIFLIPSEPRKMKQVTAKMQGMKNRRVFLVADELSELAHALINTGRVNLESNPIFHMSGAANPNSFFDPFGGFTEPKDGWGSINVETPEWDMKIGGKCLHFDQLKNPNYLLGYNKYPGIMSYEKIQKAIDEMNKDSVDFWRQYRGFWCPMGEESNIYNEADIIKYGADKRAVWMGDRTRVAACDPAFTSGGDRCILYFGWYGMTDEGVKALEFDKYYVVQENVTNKEDSRNFQMCHKIHELLKKEECLISNFAVDSTGGGILFCEMLANVMNDDSFLKVPFGGAASDLRVSDVDETPANKKYVNKVTEIWFSGQAYLRQKMLKNITPDLARELCSRKYTTRKGSDMRVMVETKSEMKLRTSGRSPDLGDGAMLLINLIRHRFGVKTRSKFARKRNTRWNEGVKKMDVASRDMTSLVVDN